MKMKYACFVAIIAFASPAMADDCERHGFCDPMPSQQQNNNVDVAPVKPERAIVTIGGKQPARQTQMPPPAIAAGKPSNSGGSVVTAAPVNNIGAVYEPVDREEIMRYSGSSEVYGDVMRSETPEIGY